MGTRHSLRGQGNNRSNTAGDQDGAEQQQSNGAQQDDAGADGQADAANAAGGANGGDNGNDGRGQDAAAAATADETAAHAAAAAAIAAERAQMQQQAADALGRDARGNQNAEGGLLGQQASQAAGSQDAQQQGSGSFREAAAAATTAGSGRAEGKEREEKAPAQDDQKYPDPPRAPESLDLTAEQYRDALGMLTDPRLDYDGTDLFNITERLDAEQRNMFQVLRRLLPLRNAPAQGSRREVLQREVWQMIGDKNAFAERLRIPADQREAAFRYIEYEYCYLADKALQGMVYIPRDRPELYADPQAPTNAEKNEHESREQQVAAHADAVYWSYIALAYLPGADSIPAILERANAAANASAQHYWIQCGWDIIPFSVRVNLQQKPKPRPPQQPQQPQQPQEPPARGPPPTSDSLLAHLSYWSLNPATTVGPAERGIDLAWRIVPHTYTAARADYKRTGLSIINYIDYRNGMGRLYDAWHNGKLNNTGVARRLDDPEIFPPSMRQRMISYWNRESNIQPPLSIWHAFMQWDQEENARYVAELEVSRARERAQLNMPQYKAALAKADKHAASCEQRYIAAGPLSIAGAAAVLDASPFPIGVPQSDELYQQRLEREQRLARAVFGELPPHLGGPGLTSPRPAPSPTPPAQSPPPASGQTAPSGVTRDSMTVTFQQSGVDLAAWEAAMMRREAKDPNDPVAQRFRTNPAQFVDRVNRAMKQRSIAVARLLENPKRRAYTTRLLYPADDPRWVYELSVGGSATDAEEEEEGEDEDDEMEDDRHTRVQDDELPPRARKGAASGAQRDRRHGAGRIDPPPPPEYDSLGRKRRYWVYLKQGDVANGLYDVIADQAYRVGKAVVYLPPAGRIVRYTAPPDGSWLGHYFQGGRKTQAELEYDALEEIAGIDDDALSSAVESSCPSDSTPDDAERDPDYVANLEEDLRATGAPIGDPVPITHVPPQPHRRPTLGQGADVPVRPLLRAQQSSAQRQRTPLRYDPKRPASDPAYIHRLQAAQQQRNQPQRPRPGRTGAGGAPPPGDDPSDDDDDHNNGNNNGGRGGRHNGNNDHNGND
jgi:hypothetical protein